MALTIKKILVPIDFSDVSSEALRYGASFAAEYGASLEVMTVAEDDSSWVVDLSDRVHVKERWREERVREGERLIREFCDPLLGGAEYGMKVHVGDPAEEIITCCVAEKPDMLILGAHGTKGVVSDWLGGVAYTVSKKAPCPVLMIKNTTKPTQT